MSLFRVSSLIDDFIYTSENFAKSHHDASFFHCRGGSLRSTIPVDLPGSGVASGWHGWTMSRGSGAKQRGPRETERKRRTGRKRKEKVGAGNPDSPLSTGPERPRYATAPRRGSNNHKLR